MQFQGSIRNKHFSRNLRVDRQRQPTRALLQVALQNATFPSKICLKYVVFGLKRGESLGQ